MVERKWEADPEKSSGVSRGPQRRQQSTATEEQLPLGARIAWYRRRRGYTQEVAAGLVGRTADWWSKVENGRIKIDRLSVLSLIADTLCIPLAQLLDLPIATAAGAPSQLATDLDRLRAVLSDYSHLTVNSTEAQVLELYVLKARIGEAWSSYQDSRYSRATRLLPEAITSARAAVQRFDEKADAHRAATARVQLAMAYQGAAMVLTKVGERDLAWLAADRGLSTAFGAHNELVLGSLYRSVAHCLLATGQPEAAAATVDSAAAHLQLRAHVGPDHLSIHGTLFLVGAMAAARAGDRRGAGQYLTHAQATADRLGYDGNCMWTAFGPTSVRMHQVSAALELGDVETALAQGERIDTSALPIERRVRHKLDLARAHHARGRREFAEALLLDADELAPEQVSSHYITRELLTAWALASQPRAHRRIEELTEALRIV